MKKFDDLLAFIAVVERGSFVAAARQLNLPPSAVTRKVQQLETRLQMTLLHRTTRRVSVTEVGREVYEAAARGYAAFEEAERLAKAHHDSASGVLRVTAPFSLLHIGLMPLLPKFLEEYPDVRIEFLVTNQRLDLVENNCDVAIRAGALPNSSDVVRPLVTTGYQLVATPEYLARAGALKRPGDLAKHPLAGLRAAGSQVATLSALPYTWVFLRGEKREEIDFNFRLAATDPIVPLDFALQGQGVGLVTGGLIREAIEQGRLAVVLPEWRIEAQLELSIVYRRRATMDPKVRVFVDFLLKSLRP
ncbi:MAG: LysR family transcriptional regulator [Hyphomicrobiales bacterium]|nr:LysR family transcriptional regulator [Hyphomicrobiales bacterium]